jgi:hypothetical protein
MSRLVGRFGRQIETVDLGMNWDLLCVLGM